MSGHIHLALIFEQKKQCIQRRNSVVGYSLLARYYAAMTSSCTFVTADKWQYFPSKSSVDICFELCWSQLLLSYMLTIQDVLKIVHNLVKCHPALLAPPGHLNYLTILPRLLTNNRTIVCWVIRFRTCYLVECYLKFNFFSSLVSRAHRVVFDFSTEANDLRWIAILTCAHLLNVNGIVHVCAAVRDL